MNDLVFVDHINLFRLDLNILKTLRYQEYMTLYRGWVQPGVEYICPRNMQFEFDSPFKTLPTQCPIPRYPTKEDSFENIFNQLGADVARELAFGRQIYLLWSGGIDSTVIATAVLKNIGSKKFDNFHIVLNSTSIEENPVFYYKFLESCNIIEFEDFCQLELDLDNSRVLTGEAGDQIFGHSIGNKILAQDPEMAAAPWRNNVALLKKFFEAPAIPSFWDLFFDIMQHSIRLAEARIETVYDFTWWLNYNFKFDSVMFRTPMTLAPHLPPAQLSKYYQKVIWNLFADTTVQQWSLSSGSAQKIGTTKKSFKYAGKLYIYNFDHNEYYFREKRKEWSLPAKVSPLIALDANYRRYSFSDREVRKTIHQAFNG